MICDKCGQMLPSDSLFCQYCGNRMEEKSSGNSNNEEVLKMMLKAHAAEAVENMKANMKSQPDHQADDDFGLVPGKPIYTFAIRSVLGEEEYLDRLYTTNGEKVTWKRLGSTSAEGVEGPIDMYETYLPSGKFYQIIYINMYGARSSTSAPRGFVLRDLVPAQSEKSSVSKNVATKRETKSFSNVMTIVMYVVTIICAIAAMNLQDIKRNAMTAISPTVLYLLLAGVCGIGVYLIVLSRKTKFPVAQHIYSVVPAGYVLAMFIEGSIFASSYVSGDAFIKYVNADLISILNAVCMLANLVVVIINLAPMLTNLKARTCASVSYRVRCYERVAKMKSYMDSGVISREEYELIKADILKQIQM